MNQSLRQALFNAHLSEQDIAARLDVDPKTVRRWLEGRLPYARHRWELSQLLATDEPDLWPELRAVRAAKSRPVEISAVYPRRASITLEGWRTLFSSGRECIDILVYSGLFLAENAEILQVLGHRARAGAVVRVALGDPESESVAKRGVEESIGDAMAAKIRNAIALYQPLFNVEGISFRLHRSVLYNSIYRVDDEMLVNQHLYGVSASQAPVYHLHRACGGEMFDRYLMSFDRVWKDSLSLDLPI
ncbi:DUF5919 domain-containing protein [Kribbella yunnanensis]|uniref:DUF5919 domain-containing protein n=1 Tax=Kribbella yunnanensis TaxID=190194 RepID=A0ABP4US67_9ACTN